MSERYTIIIEAGRDSLNREPHIRLRMALKLLLRRFGLRCTEITPAAPPEARQHAEAPVLPPPRRTRQEPA